MVIRKSGRYLLACFLSFLLKAACFVLFLISFILSLFMKMLVIWKISTSKKCQLLSRLP